MKLSWTSLKISIAGAKLSHLVQKDRIWDHGSMAEQARIIFYLVYKIKSNGNLELLRKQCTMACYEKIKAELESGEQKDVMILSPVIEELAIIDVKQGKNNKPDMFSALIKGVLNEKLDEFKTEWLFMREGNWWVLHEIIK